MPIEIRELVIKATVDPVTQGGQSQTPGTGTITQGNSSLNEDLIKACVDKVLDILKEKNER